MNGMTDQSKWMIQMMDTAKESFEAGMHMVNLFDKQTETTFALSIESSEMILADGFKTLNRWIDHVRALRKTCNDVFIEGFAIVEQQHATRNQTQQKPTKRKK